jgi:hypothetical protein
MIPDLAVQVQNHQIIRAEILYKIQVYIKVCHSSQINRAFWFLIPDFSQS